LWKESEGSRQTLATKKHTTEQHQKKKIPPLEQGGEKKIKETAKKENIRSKEPSSGGKNPKQPIPLA